VWPGRTSRGIPWHPGRYLCRPGALLDELPAAIAQILWIQARGAEEFDLLGWISRSNIRCRFDSLDRIGRHRHYDGASIYDRISRSASHDGGGAADASIYRSRP